MSISSAQTTAVIYDFAAHARALRAARDQSTDFAKGALPAVQANLPRASFGGASYHEAAIVEADATRRQ